MVVVAATLSFACRGEAAPSDPPATPSASEPLPVTLVEVTELVGLDFRHQTGSSGEYPMPAIMGGGAAVFDYDGDQDLDLYFVQAGVTATDRLYRHEADGRFADVTAESGLSDTGYGMGCAVGDVDNDGDLDLFVSNFGPDALFRNQGDGTFTDMTRDAGVAGDAWSASAVFFDYDLDGWLDLFVTRYVAYERGRVCATEGGRRDYCGPAQFPGVPATLYRNLGAGRFEDRSQESGIAAAEERGLGVVAVDLDGDAWLDLYVANDSDPNQLWINQRDGTFSDDAVLLGAAFNRYGVAEAGMGLAAGDADGDLDLDLFVTNLIEETNTLYENLGGALGFEDQTAERGLGVPSLPYTGFGTAFFDLECDGDLDVAVANGAIKLRPAALRADGWFWNGYAEPNLLFLNDGAGRFVDESSRAGPFASQLEVSRGLVPFDLEGDGDLDLLVTKIEGPARLYRNDGGNERAWLVIRVLDPALQREAVGAMVTVHTTKARYLRPAISFGGYLTSTDARIHLGLGDAERVERFEVVWPGGVRETFAGVEARRTVVLRRGEGR